MVSIDKILFYHLQVHEEFKQNVENIGIENLIQKFTEQKATGKERPSESQIYKTLICHIYHFR